MFYLIRKNYLRILALLLLLSSMFIFSYIMYPIGMPEKDMTVKQYFLVTMGLQFLGAFYLEWFFSYTYNLEGKDHNKINAITWISMFAAKIVSYGTIGFTTGLVSWNIAYFLLIFIFPLVGSIFHFLIVITALKALRRREEKREMIR